MDLGNWMRIEQVSPDGRAEIGGRRIYILPTKYGLMFGALLFLMLLGAVNYGNNPAHLLTFLLAGIGGNAIYLTWRNLRGLRIEIQGAAPVFAGQEAHFGVRLDAGARDRAAIQLMFADSEPLLADLAAGEGAWQGELRLPTHTRGWHDTGRLVISTHYPLGLLRAWCHVANHQRVLVYPTPGEPWTPRGGEVEDHDGGSAGQGNDDFAGLRGYQSGDQASRIDWKSYARDRGLNTRLFSGLAAVPLWLNWQDAAGQNDEQRIAALSRAVVDAEERGQFYGLHTPGGSIQPGRGHAHRHLCLRHLALLGSDDA